MPAEYPVPAETVRVETRVSNSRFIATLGPVFSVDEAKAFVAGLRTEFSDASHNVPAYLVGFGDSQTAHCSDAGEPSGTAGQPALAVLRGSGFGDVAVVVTRYFGGTKLGTGGLVRAYGDAVRQAVLAAPRARRVPTHTVLAAYPYRLVEPVRRLVAAQHGSVLDEEFAAEVTLTARFPAAALTGFQAALQELTNGQSEALIIASAEVLVRE